MFNTYKSEHETWLDELREKQDYVNSIPRYYKEEKRKVSIMKPAIATLIVITFVVFLVKFPTILRTIPNTVY